MMTLYLTRQGCVVHVHQETLQIKEQGKLIQTVQLPQLSLVLVLGVIHWTTPALRACLQRQINVAFLSRQGWCYGHLTALECRYRHLMRLQQNVSAAARLQAAQRIVQAKLLNSRVLLMRQQRRDVTPDFSLAIRSLAYLAERTTQTTTTEELMGLEGTGAALYFQALGQCLEGMSLVKWSRRPPLDPANALLGFGYAVVWNHIYALLELHGLDPYEACLHQGHRQHAALTSDLLEEFRAPLIDSLVLQLVNSRVIKPDDDFEFREGGCFLNESGKRKFLQAFLQRMEPKSEASRWNTLDGQVRSYRKFIYQSEHMYEPFRIR